MASSAATFIYLFIACLISRVNAASVKLKFTVAFRATAVVCSTDKKQLNILTPSPKYRRYLMS